MTPEEAYKRAVNLISHDIVMPRSTSDIGPAESYPVEPMDETIEQVRNGTGAIDETTRVAIRHALLVFNSVGTALLMA